MPKLNEAEAIYHVAEQFRDRCLAQNGSLLWPARTAWTVENLDGFWDAFVGRPDEGERDFLEKWHDQLADQPTDMHRIAADLLVFYWLCPTNVRAREKFDQVKTVVSWKLSDDEPDYGPLQAAFASGFANPGPFYLIRKYHQIVYYLDFARSLKKEGVDPRDSRASRTLADQVQKRTEGSRSARHVLLHLLFPDEFERIASDTHKKQIVAAFQQLAGGIKDVDEALKNVRSELGKQYENSDFYSNRQIRALWNPKSIKYQDISGETIPQVSEEDARRAWMFQANPGLYDIRAALRALRSHTWLVTKHQDEIQVGDRVYIWESGGEGGIVGVGSVSAPVAQTVSPPEELRFAKDRTKFEGVQSRAVLSIELVVDPPVSREEVRRYPKLGGVSILRSPQGTNFPVTDEEAEALDELLSLRIGVARAPTYSPEDCARITGLELADINRWIRAVERKGQAIIYGPPGTGKTFLAKQLARCLISNTDGFIDVVQFHPAYAYEDFIQGIRPRPRAGGGLEYPLIPGRFFEFCNRARAVSGKAVEIVDEINRANLPRVFGELMYLLEYRDEKIPLAAGGIFHVPRNVRIIGTMNTADRSIALVDHALRRRFAFIALYPNYEILRKFHEGSFNPSGLIEVLRQLNNQIANKHYEVGVTFFLKPDLASDLEDVWRMEIEPYLEEYFFDQPEKADSFNWKEVGGRILHG